MPDETFTSPFELLIEEQELVLHRVDEVVCYRLGSVVAEHGLAMFQPLAVSVRLGEREVFRVGLPGSTALSDTILTAKWNTARRGGHSSLYERNVRLSRGTTFEDETELRFPEHAAFGGAIPLRESGQTEAAAYVIVSGLTQEEDHAIVVAAIRSVIASDLCTS